MAKSLVFGNGRLHIGLNEHGLVHDVYYPYIGLENQLPSHGLPHKIGVYVDGSLSWLDDGAWTIQASYYEKAMIGHTVVTHEALAIRVEFTDAVDSGADAFIRSMHVINMRADKRSLKLYCHQALMLGDSASSDSAQYRPDVPGLMHYKGKRVFIASLKQGDAYFDDFSIGKYDLETGASTYHDAEDGVLAKNMVDNGRVDSVLGLQLDLDPFASARAEYVLVAGESVGACELSFEELRTNGLTHSIARTAAYWQEWVGRALFPARLLPDRYSKMVETSLFVIKAHIDQRGAVMASLDSSLRNHPQDDSYNFCWPRDAVYALWPLLRLGYTEEILQFFNFTQEVISDEGFLAHKYRADGSLGSTWLPYVHPDGSVQAPIQADETAGVLFLMGQYYRQTGDKTFCSTYYETLIEPMANFLSTFVFDDGLPRPSYDLWEHTYSTSTYTTAITYASLIEATELADAYGRSVDAQRWTDAAESMKKSSSCLYNPERNYFYKGFTVNEAGERLFDELLDMSSLYGVFMYGLFELESPEIVSAIQTARNRMQTNGLYKRFDGDDYYSEDAQSNVWPLVSLWMAEMLLERDSFEEAEQIMSTVLSTADMTKMLPEQVDPMSLQATSLSPLVWSHAEFISTCIDYVQAKRTQENQL